MSPPSLTVPNSFTVSARDVRWWLVSRVISTVSRKNSSSCLHQQLGRQKYERNCSFSVSYFSFTLYYELQGVCILFATHSSNYRNCVGAPSSKDDHTSLLCLCLALVYTFNYWNAEQCGASAHLHAFEVLLRWIVTLQCALI